MNKFFFKSFLTTKILSACCLAQVSELKLIIISDLKHSHVFKNENEIFFINSNLFSFKITKENINLINSVILNAKVLMLMSMT